MSNPVWPSSLPEAPLPGWSEMPRSQFETFKVGVGPSKRRRRTTSVRVARKLPLELTGAQLATLKTFFDTTCEGGVLAWDWTNGDPVTGATVTYRFLKPVSATGFTPSPDVSTRLYNVVLDVETV